MRRKDLSNSQRFLLNVMQSIRYGQIANLGICDGQPVFTQRTHTYHMLKFGSTGNDDNPDFSDDYELKKQVVEMFETFEMMNNGKVLLLEIQDGLPFDMFFEEDIAAI